ncbi:MAG: YibE/F family protein, partial [Ilumatobacteraceae bacterium]
VGLVALWPGGRDGLIDPAMLGTTTAEAEVVFTDYGPCTGTVEADRVYCEFATLEITSGDTAGDTSVLETSLDASGANLESGDRILVNVDRLDDGRALYSFNDFQRGRSMTVLVVLFVLAVLVLGRWKGAGALAGLVVSLAVLTAFALPSLLDGNAPLLVAIVAASSIAFVAIFLAHGVNIASAVSLLSSFVSLVVTGLLGWIFVNSAHFTGYTEESSFFLNAFGVPIDARGILLAGIIIGSLGVLDDVIVTQVSAVAQLKRACPDSGWRELFRPALDIGRDHVSSTVNTLFLAYAGAALPLLLLFSEARQSISGVATREVVAVEIVRALVGSIGLVASVPISTLLASLAISGREPDERSHA